MEIVIVALMLAIIGMAVLGSYPLGAGQLAEALTGASAILSGTLVGASASAIVSGGRTIVLTLSGDTWVASGAAFDAERQNIIDGLDSAQAGPFGWDAVVKAGLAVGAVVRTSDTVVTITLSAFPTYAITATETITATIPGSALALGAPLVASPTVSISRTQAGLMPRHMNNRIESYLLDPASVAYSNPQRPLLGIVDPTVNSLTANITYYLNNNAVAQGGNPNLSTRGGRFMALMNASAGS